MRAVAGRLLVLQHIGCEPPAAYEDELRAWDIELVRVQLDAGEPLPDWRRHAGIVAMGGPMGAGDDEHLPWLAPEKRLIGDAVRAGLPYWGVCLGVQLLAASLGARVFTGARAEVGMLPVSLAAAAATDPVFGMLPARFAALQWHGDTYELPDGARRLARSELYEQQAFAFERAYGLQFHLEVTCALAAEWMAIPAYTEELEALAGPGTPAAMEEQVRAIEADSVPLARGLFARWLQNVAGFAPAGH
jgi:GMP synthase (glutamine-hydrolysing)